MGKRLESQRRGKGSPTFKATHKMKKSQYPSNTLFEGKTIKAQVISLFKDSGRQAAMQKLLLEDNSVSLIVAPEGAFTGQEIEIGENAGIRIGNIAPLESIPEGCPVFNIELAPGDGGKIARATGKYAILLRKGLKNASIKLPSGKAKDFNLKCLATIGIASGGERTDKPLIKAGNSYHLKKSKKKFWPTVRGVKKNAVDHPFGGSQHHAGKSKSTSRHAPPGRKVGNIAYKRTGRKKK